MDGFLIRLRTTQTAMKFITAEVRWVREVVWDGTEDRI